MKFLFFFFLWILFTIQLWSQEYPIVKEDSLSRIELDEVRICGSKRGIQSNTFKTKSKLLRFGYNCELLCQENIAVKISSNIREFFLIKSVEIPLKRKGENKIKQPQFYLRLGNSPSDSLFSLVSKEFKITQTKMLITFDQVIKLDKNSPEFFFLMDPNCSADSFSCGYLLEFNWDYKSQFTYEYSKQNSFKIKDFRKGNLANEPGFPNWRIKISYATAKYVN